MSELNGLFKKRNGHSDSLAWEIKNTKFSGRGLYATKKINPGEIIIKENPLVVGPSSIGKQLAACVVCLSIKKPLRKCVKNCHLPVCSEECENSPKHTKECEFLSRIHLDDDSWSLNLYLALAPLRCLLLGEEDRFVVQNLHSNSKESVQKQVDKIKNLLGEHLSEDDEKWIHHCCGVLNGTAFKIEFKSDIPFHMRGLYPLASILNHQCSPNSRHYFEKNNPLMMCMVASKPINEGEEITSHYCPLLWATNPRRMFLHLTKEFLCNCSRCQDPSEFGTFLSALLCCCGGIVLPISPLEFASDWQCGSCSKTLTTGQIAKVQAILGKTQCVDLMEQILHPNNGISLEYKMGTINKLGQRLNDLSDEELLTKEKLEKDILEVNEKLKLGDSRTKGILCFGLYNTLAQKRLRNIQLNPKELEEYYTKAKEILGNDDTAPNVD